MKSIFGQTFDTFQGFDTIKQMKIFFHLLVLFTAWFMIGIVPFVRRDFGERYLSWPNLFFGYTVVANFTFLGNMIAVGGGGSFSFLMLFFFAVFVASSIYHRWEISRKNAAGQLWHSMYPGTSILPLPLSAEAMQKWVEPGLTFVLGLVLYQFVTVVGIWLLVSAFALLLHNHLVYYYQRQLILDRRDAQIEAQNMQAALDGRPAAQTAGFVIAESSLQLVRQDAGLKAAFMALSDDLKAVMKPADTLGAQGKTDAFAQAGAAS